MHKCIVNKSFLTFFADHAIIKGHRQSGAAKSAEGAHSAVFIEKRIKILVHVIIAWPSDRSDARGEEVK